MEIENFKEKIGKLGVHLINKGKKKIRNINKKYLLEEAEINKRFEEEIYDESTRIRRKFIEKFNKILNDYQFQLLSKVRNELLGLKNDLIKNLKSELIGLIKQKIEDDYTTYIEFILNRIKNFSRNLNGKSENLIIKLNNRDYEYFNRNFNLLDDIFGDPIDIKRIQDQIIGGFEIFLNQEKITFDFTFINLIENNSILIEKEFSRFVSDENFKSIEHEFEKYIQNKSFEIKTYEIINHLKNKNEA
ncbi:MAG: hypothetical protein GF329_12905 [Candidatus Lokiarchaeota archaeon]|nr:hypothetical protein [Candidatus Lokiarchaeota archaeon]